MAKRNNLGNYKDRIQKGIGRLPNGFIGLDKNIIIQLAKTGSEERDALASLGLQPYQIDIGIKNKRWRRIWDKARAEWIVEKNKQISESNDVRMLSLLAPKTMPESDLGDKVVFTIDAPEWFIKALALKEKHTKKIEYAGTEINS